LLAVADQPLSTFSIDVDTASYSNARRFLNGGTLPPKDSIRVEEWLNYFGYDYPDPASNEPFSVTSEVSACPWNPAHRLVRLGLKTQQISQAATPPRNWVFLVDVSGSMMPENRLPLLKRGLALLAENLRPKDSISIVVYAGSSGLALPTTTGSDRGRVLDALGRLEASRARKTARSRGTLKCPHGRGVHRTLISKVPDSADVCPTSVHNSRRGVRARSLLRVRLVVGDGESGRERRDQRVGRRGSGDQRLCNRWHELRHCG